MCSNKYNRVVKITVKSNNVDKIIREYGIFTGMSGGYCNFTVYYDAKTKTNTIYAMGTGIMMK